jgi:flagellar L-ring protein precursor FlgH
MFAEWLGAAMRARRTSAIASAAAALVLGASSATAQTTQAAVPSRPVEFAVGSKDLYDQLFAKYLTQARETAVRENAGMSWGWMNGLALDTRARNVNDILTIRVIENISGAGSADAALSKESEGSASIMSLFGLETKVPSPINLGSLLGGKSATDFQGNGTTTRQGVLTAMMTARVAEVLPSGDMVIEGVREIDINGDRQILVLTGVVRPADVGPSNVVLSPSVGQLRIRYFGQGLMRDNLRPGFLIRLINKIF